MIEVRDYVDADGKSRFATWFDKLNARAAAKVTVAVSRVVLGNLSSVKSLGQGVLEIRVDFGPGYRVYFGRDGDRVVILLGGGTKKRQQADIARAKVLWQEYKTRKKRGI